MAHVKHITSTKVSTLSSIAFGKGTLNNAIDNAGQTLWAAFSPYHKDTMHALSQFAESAGLMWDENALSDARVIFVQYSSRLISNTITPPVKFKSEDIHRFLSLEHYLQPEPEHEIQQGIVLALAHLKLPPVMPPEKLRMQLSSLLQSIKETFIEQDKKGRRFA